MCLIAIGIVVYLGYQWIYLQINGMWAVAEITAAAPSSEGTNYSYEFMYRGVQFRGGFTGLTHKIGDKYFVLFSPEDPDRNLLQYNTPVPDCLKGAVNQFWKQQPTCP